MDEHYISSRVNRQMKFERKAAVVVPTLKVDETPKYVYIERPYHLQPANSDGDSPLPICHVIDLEVREHRQMILTTQLKDAMDKMVKVDEKGNETETYVNRAFEVRMVGSKKSAGGRTFFQMEVYEIALPDKFDPIKYVKGNNAA